MAAGAPLLPLLPLLPFAPFPPFPPPILGGPCHFVDERPLDVVHAQLAGVTRPLPTARGVQEARDLIAGAGLSPARSPCKIYIIDEVHMLTKEAFNTLLKIMEEPPPHVKFILCTTEPEKVPATIQSRCQRFDFRALSSAEVAAQLEKVLAAEGVAAEPAVVQQVARLGRGSMRDARRAGT